MENRLCKRSHAMTRFNDRYNYLILIVLYLRSPLSQCDLRFVGGEMGSILRGVSSSTLLGCRAQRWTSARGWSVWTRSTGLAGAGGGWASPLTFRQVAAAAAAPPPQPHRPWGEARRRRKKKRAAPTTTTTTWRVWFPLTSCRAWRCLQRRMVGRETWKLCWKLCWRRTQSW